MIDRRKELLVELRDYMQQVPDDEFCYSDFFRTPMIYFFPRSMDQLKTRCGTTACLAGHACVLWREYLKQELEIGCLGVETAIKFMDLDGDTGQFLFYKNCGRAFRTDAIRRLQWLIDEKNIEEYDFNLEGQI